MKKKIDNIEPEISEEDIIQEIAMNFEVIELPDDAKIPEEADISFKPDYSLWLRMPYWTYQLHPFRSEAILLSEDIDIYKVKSFVGRRDPKALEKWGRPRIYKKGNYKRFGGNSLLQIINVSAETLKIKHTLLKRAIRVGEIKLLNTPNFDDPNAEYLINPQEFIRWLSNKGLSYPQEFDSLMDGDPFIDLKPYLNKNHPEYSVELAAAVKVWEAMFVDKKYDPNFSQNLREQVGTWLEQNYGKRLNRGCVKEDTATLRISTLVTPDKLIKGGRPRKQSNLKGKK